MHECNGVFVGGVIKSLTNCFTVLLVEKGTRRVGMVGIGGVTLTFK